MNAAQITDPSSSSSTSTTFANVKGQVRQFLAYEPRALRILVACVLAVISSALDPPFLALTSDPVQGFLRTPESRAPLLVALGFLILAVITLIGGTTGDLFGRRRLLLVGLAGLVSTNLLGSFTVGTPLHIPIYALSLVCVGFVVPMTVAIVTLAFEPAVRPFAFGMVFGAQGLALALSSTIKWLAGLSGMLWWSFVPVVIVGVVAIWHVVRHVPESTSRRAIQPMSAVVNVALLVVTFLIIFILLTSGTLIRSWSLALIALGMLLLAGWTGRWWLQRLSQYVTAEVFTGRDLVLAILAGVVISGVQIAFLFEFGTFSREVQGISSFLTNLRIVPYVLGVLTGSVLIQHLTLRFGTPQCIAIGMALMAFGLLSLALIQPETPFWVMLIPILVLGFGFGVATPARAQVILSTPPVTLVGGAAAINTATGQLGNAIGVTLASVIVTQLADAAFLVVLQAAGVSQSILNQVRSVLPDFNQVRAYVPELAASPAAPTATIPETVIKLIKMDYAGAWTSGLGRLFFIFGIAMLVGAGIVYVVMVVRARAPNEAHVPAPPLSQSDTPL